jgi:hypothetical protein
MSEQAWVLFHGRITTIQSPEGSLGVFCAFMVTFLKTMQTSTTKMECWEPSIRLHGITPQISRRPYFCAIKNIIHKNSMFYFIPESNNYWTINAKHVEFDKKIDHKHAYGFWSMAILYVS